MTEPRQATLWRRSRSFVIDGGKPMSSSEAVFDNLEVIKGVGPDARQWLAEAFEVRTFAALAELSGEELISRIKVENKPSNWIRWAKDWPTEAAKRAAEMGAEVEARQPASESDRRNNDLPPAEPDTKSSSPKPSSPAGRKDGWDTLALYFIEFQSRQVPGKPIELQTKVVFEGPGPQTQETLSGIEQDRICQWIFEHAGSIMGDMPAVETPLNAKATPQETGFSAIAVSQLRLFQPAGTGSLLFSYSSDRPQVSTIIADQPFDLEVILEENRPQASVNGRIAFNVQVYFNNQDNNDYTTLDNVEPEAIEDQLGYSALLPGLSLPRGKYRLRVLVLAHPKPVVLDSIEIPVLSVW